MVNNCNFKMTKIFAAIGRVTSTARKSINNVSLKKLANRVQDLQIFLILENEMLFLIFL